VSIAYSRPALEKHRLESLGPNHFEIAACYVEKPLSRPAASRNSPRRFMTSAFGKLGRREHDNGARGRHDAQATSYKAAGPVRLVTAGT
jgi:hypothetical protein